MKNILIIGYDSYLGSGIKFDNSLYNVKQILRPLEKNFDEYNDFDFIINFCIQPEHFSQLLSEDEMIDLSIAKHIVNNKTKYVFLSSRKVYGSNCELKIYKETDDIKPYDFYSKNKVNIEQILKKLLGNNLLITRTGNIIGIPPNRKNYTTFIGWLENEFTKNQKVNVTINKNAKKDFITKEYFQKSLISLIDNNQTGIYNIGSNFALSTEELILNILPEKFVEFSPKEKESEQFILDCAKLHKYNNKFTQKDLKEECSKIKKYLMEKIA